MANTGVSQPSEPVTAEAFMATRLKFWGAFTKFTTNVVIFLVVLMAFLWWWLV